MAKVDLERRDAVSKLSCSSPGCELKISARVPSDPTKVFDADGVRYEGHCPQHGRVT